jgi:oligopeptide transport system substrate-binding protein
MWRRTSLGVVATLALVLAACGGGGSPTPGGSTAPGESTAPSAPTAEQVLRVPGSDADPPTLDPNLAEDTASVQVINQIARPLLWTTPDLALTADGGLAADLPEISSDGMTITFTLRDGIKFSNGDPITANDFVYSWKRAVDPRTAAPYSYVFADVEGAGDLLDMAGADPAPSDAEIDAALENLGVEATDDSTFVIHLSRAAAYFPFVTSLWVTAPISKDWIDSGESYTEAENYVGSGPFKMESWSHDEEIVLVPNENWYGDQPKLSELHIVYGSDPDGFFRAYQNGEVDLAGVPPTNAEQVRNDPEMSQQAVTGSRLCTYYLGFGHLDGTSDSPVENKTFRHAVQEAIDQQSLIDTVLSGIGTPADSFIPPGMPGHEDYGFGLSYDPTKAQTDLETALGELGISDASTINLTLGFNTGSGHEDIMQSIQASLQDNLGIQVTLQGEEWSVYLQTLRENPPDMYRLGWCADYPHPNNWLYDVFSCDTARGGFCDEAMDELLSQAQVTPKLEDQLPLYQQAQEMLVDDAPAVWVYWYGRFTVVQPYVQGLVVTAGDSATGDHFYDQISIADH